VLTEALGRVVAVALAEAVAVGVAVGTMGAGDSDGVTTGSAEGVAWAVGVLSLVAWLSA
jgi:hypothetical protein